MIPPSSLLSPNSRRYCIQSFPKSKWTPSGFVLTSNRSRCSTLIAASLAEKCILNNLLYESKCRGENPGFCPGKMLYILILRNFATVVSPMSRQETLLNPLGSQETDPRLASGILFLAIQQREERESHPPLPDNLASRKKIFSWFRGTPEFGQIYSQSLHFFLIPRSEEEVKTIKFVLAGSFFQQIAFATVSQNLPDELLLLSPERTLDFYQLLFPRAMVIKHPLGTDSLRGISVPDGLLIKNSSNDIGILAAVEYTLEGKTDYFQKKILPFKGDQDRFPSLLRNSQLLFVTPTFSRQRPYLPSVWKAKIQELPFTHHQFRNFSSWIYEHHRQYQNIHEPDDTSATLKEIQERVREQKKDFN